jgi:hypothetical protein
MPKCDLIVLGKLIIISHDSGLEVLKSQYRSERECMHGFGEDFASCADLAVDELMLKDGPRALGYRDVISSHPSTFNGQSVFNIVCAARTPSLFLRQSACP